MAPGAGEIGAVLRLQEADQDHLVHRRCPSRQGNCIMTRPRARSHGSCGYSGVSGMIPGLTSIRHCRIETSVHAVLETPTFLRDVAQNGMSEDQRERIVRRIAENPMQGDVIPGTGGARKV